MIPYKVVGTINGAKAETIVLFDKTNSSIHLHIYCEELGNKKIPIDVKRIATVYPIDDTNSVIQKIMNEEMIDNYLTFECIEKISGVVTYESLYPIRIIRRYKK